jgi:hypothetical protein
VSSRLFRGINVGFYMQYISVLSFSFQRCVPKFFNIYLLREAWRSGKNMLNII